jgi:hypothetical protein
MFVTNRLVPFIHSALQPWVSLGLLKQGSYTPVNLHEPHPTKRQYQNETRKNNKVEEHNSTSNRAYDFEKPDVDKTLSNAELNAGELFPRTTGCILAIQDQVYSTRSYKK